MASKTARRLPWQWTMMMVGLSLFGAIYGTYRLQIENDIARRGTSVAGVVAWRYADRADIDYSYHGLDFRLRTQLHPATHGQVYEGDPIPVRFLPERPNDATISVQSSRRSALGGLLGGALALLLAAAWEMLNQWLVRKTPLAH